MTAISSARQEDGATRWIMLGIISLGFISLTLNWFDVATAFGLIGAEFKVGLPSLSYLISLFIVGYGLAHIPGGMLATKLGMKRTLVLGLVIQGAGRASCPACPYSYLELDWFRLICGIGGSAFIAVGFAAVIVWFRQGAGHAGAGHQRRGGLQRGRGVRPVHLDLPAERDELAHLAGAGRRLRAARRRR